MKVFLSQFRERLGRSPEFSFETKVAMVELGSFSAIIWHFGVLNKTGVQPFPPSPVYVVFA